MGEYTKTSENISRTLDGNPKASKQGSISEILQAYKNGTLQRMGVDEEELLQAKTRDKSSERETLQGYTEYAHRDRSGYNALIQGVFGTPQRKGIEDDELLQGKFDSSSVASESLVQREVKPNNTGLPDNLKSGIENLSGYSMDDVKVHYNSDKPAQLSALAYAQGTDIHVAPGQEKHLPHEAWHVVQQKQGRVQPTMQMQGVDVNDNEGLEKEADVMGEKTVQYKSNLSNPKKLKGIVINHDKVQRKVEVRDDEIQPLIKQIKDEESYTFCAKSEKKVYIKKGIISQTIPLTAHNKDRLETNADVEITLKDEDISNGLKIDPHTTINADGRSKEIIPVMEDTGFMPIFDITGKYETIKKEVRKEQRDIIPNNLSGATVLLHEMGHAVQYLNTLPDHTLKQQRLKGLQLLNMPELNNIGELSNDISNGIINSKRWPLRVFELSDMGMILNILKDIAKEDDLTKLREMESLRLSILDRVKIWMEHDVMINVEHPFAKKCNEGIRLRHGEELDQRKPRIQDKGKWLELTHDLKDDRTVENKNLLNVNNAKYEMIERLKKDSCNLPQMMTHLVLLYKEFFNKYEGGFDGFLSDYVDGNFKN